VIIYHTCFRFLVVASIDYQLVNIGVVYAVVIYNVCFYSHYYTLSRIMLVIIIILYPFAYNKQQTQNIKPYKQH